jgi:predicted transcriptional regulator
MTNESESKTVADVLARLREIARLLREVPHLDPNTQQMLADLVEELSKTLEAQTLPAQEATHLADCAAHLMQSVQEKKEKHVIADARTRLEKAIVGVETRSPILSGLFERLVDALAGLGI